MVNSTPNQPELNNPYFAQRDSSVKAADPQFFILTDPALPPEELENAIWQNIGGHEIISLVRRDLVDGQNFDYKLINNLARLYEEYNPKTIFALEDTGEKYFARFGLKLEKFVPSQESLSAIDSFLESPVTLDESNNLIIYVNNIKDNQEVEVQVIASGELLRDTIYGEEL